MNCINLKHLSLKHLCLIAAASLTFALLVYSRTPNPGTALNSQTTRETKLQAAQKAIENGALSRIVTSANEVLKKSPSTAQLKKIENPTLRTHLEQGRKLIEAGKSAAGWNAVQLVEYQQQVEQNAKSIGGVFKGLAAKVKIQMQNSCVNTCDNNLAGCLSTCNNLPIFKDQCAASCYMSSIGCLSGCGLL